MDPKPEKTSQDMGEAFPGRDGFDYKHLYFQLLRDSPAVQQFIYQESIIQMIDIPFLFLE